MTDHQSLSGDASSVCSGVSGVAATPVKGSASCDSSVVSAGAHQSTVSTSNNSVSGGLNSSSSSTTGNNQATPIKQHILPPTSSEPGSPQRSVSGSDILSSPQPGSDILSTPQTPSLHQDINPNNSTNPLATLNSQLSPDDDDDDVHTLNSAYQAHQGGGVSQSTVSSVGNSTSTGMQPESNKIVRFLGKARKSLNNISSSLNANKNTNRSAIDDDEDDDGGDGLMQEGVLISGYLQKLGRNDKWQLRWFETDGECLSYYKSEKRNKLLATLDLEKVGDIAVDPSDSHERSFTIQVLDRLYHLRASSRAICKDWVITLNRVREANLNQGNVQLLVTAGKSTNKIVDLLDPSVSTVSTQGSHPRRHQVTPRVVVVANRHRARAVAESVEWDELMYQKELAGGDAGGDADLVGIAGGDADLVGIAGGDADLVGIAGGDADLVGTNDPAQEDPPEIISTSSTIGTRVLTKWTKHKSNLSRVGAKLLKWARSVRQLQCLGGGPSVEVELDPHVHPPGHDDHHKSRSRKTRPKAGGNDGLSDWIGNETLASGSSSVAVSTKNSDVSSPKSSTGGNRLIKRSRSLSMESDPSERIIS